jgi:hypothetical protein
MSQSNQIKPYKQTDREILEQVMAEQRQLRRSHVLEIAAFARYNQLTVWAFEAGALPINVFNN